MPKTASTAVKRGLIRTFDLEEQPENLWSHRVSNEFPALARLWPAHMKELDAQIVTVAEDLSKILRLHVLPTKNNLSILETVPKVVLLRDPSEVVYSLYRSVQAGLGPKPMDFKYCGHGPDAWFRRAESLGILEDLQRFRDKWIESSATIVEHEELTNQPDRVLSSILNTYGLPNRTIELRFENSTRTNSRILQVTKAKMSRIIQCIRS